MVNGPSTADAVTRARKLPRLHVGLHLVLVEGVPMLPPDQIPNLVDHAGLLRCDLARLGAGIALRPAVRHQLRAEITAQFEAYRSTALPLDHVSAHKHFHLHPVVAQEIIAIGRRFAMRALRVPAEPRLVVDRVEKCQGKIAIQLLNPWVALLRAQARRAGLLTPDAVFGLHWSGGLTKKRLVGLLSNLPPGLIEIYTHPAIADTFPGRAPGYRYKDELGALCAPEAMAALQESNFRLGSYGNFSVSLGPSS
jgi:chitin disaccharide deacetylase